VGAHLGHVVNAYPDTPDKMGLLPIALAEAKTAVQHTELALKAPDNLEGLQQHAGHVMHALDPAAVATGPGKGYGVKRAAAGIVTHMELAAKTNGASPNVITHSGHIATAAQSVVARVDQILALARDVRSATTAEAAASLMQQILSLAGQLTTGVDTNTDGRIGWNGGEGGLQQAQEHMTLLLAGEKMP
jgi:hypothetical protein